MIIINTLFLFFYSSTVQSLSSMELKSSIKAPNNTTISSVVPNYYDESLGKYVLQNKRDEVILLLISHLKTVADPGIKLGGSKFKEEAHVVIYNVGLKKEMEALMFSTGVYAMNVNKALAKVQEAVKKCQAEDVKKCSFEEDLSTIK
ncbi:hypothetical protein MTR67_040904 [Solanum verrucosum]|uniref:Uncharacterized protein n=1 Tax=Solanum verrucosum TaxID=315347 RepID=A0AAF0ULN5_SOLVR|nr:hypothetical protein MTR67_040904 [Solanum verrucosum]